MEHKINRSRIFHAGKGIEAPFTVGVVLLDDGPAVRATLTCRTDDGLSIGEFCGPGEGAALLARGETEIGGRCAVSASGGLLSMGHPIGPTGVGQVCEVVRQLRGEAGPRQQSDARTGLTHMVGVGAVCVVHVLQQG